MELLIKTLFRLIFWNELFFKSKIKTPLVAVPIISLLFLILFNQQLCGRVNKVAMNFVYFFREFEPVLSKNIVVEIFCRFYYPDLRVPLTA